jgi:cobalt/nickel transport system ATP-binding protein
MLQRGSFVTVPIFTTPIFEVRDVTYRYHEVTALDGLNLTIMPGQRIAVLGANGSGKSTLLSILDGLYFPQKGSVSFCGGPLTEDRLQTSETEFGFRRRVALVFQNPDVQLFNPTVFDEVAFGPLQVRWAKDEIVRSVTETLARMEISHLKDRSPHHLSTGEKKRVALASVLILDPDVLLLDEPTAALDPKSESHMIDFLVSCGGGRKTLVTATHDLDLVEDIADICHVFQSGRIVATGTPSAILNDEALLLRTNLIHAHRHAHAPGELHYHPHRHGHRH